MHKHIIARIVFSGVALVLAACAGQATTTQEQSSDVTVTARRTDERESGRHPNAPPPPAPPPAADMRMPTPNIGGAMMSRGMAPYAQIAPQPMPGSVDRDRYDHQEANPVRQVAAEPVSTFSIDVDTASYSNVRRFVNEGRLPPRDAVRIEELINYFDYDYPLPRARAEPFSSTISVVPSPWAEGRQLLHIGLQGYDIQRATRPPLNLVLLIDVSGSMAPANRLPLALEGFRMMTQQLTARDKVSIVVYAGAAGAVLDPTSGADHSRILAALDNLHAGGSTAGGEGLRLAYALARRNFNRGAVNRVMIATDGDFNVGINDPQQLQDFVSQQRGEGIYLSVLGFGGGNYNDALMQRLAQNGNGVAAYIDTQAEARRVLSDELSGALFPIANDVKIQIEFNPGRIAEYRLIGYETRMLRREDFSNDAVDAGEIGAGHSVTAIYELTPVGGPAQIEPLRYPQGGAVANNGPRSEGATANFNRELGFLRIRYKLPGETTSRLIEHPLTDADVRPSLAQAPESTRWATAIAGYGQLLRGDPYLAQSYGFDDVIALAQGARGRDEFGWRAEFVQLARQASTLQGLPTQRPTPTPEARPIPGPAPMPRR